MNEQKMDSKTVKKMCEFLNKFLKHRSTENIKKLEVWFSCISLIKFKLCSVMEE